MQQHERTRKKHNTINENAKVKLRDFLLYVKFYYALTHGDIGHVEATLVDWSFMYKAVHKHKYVAAILEMLFNLN